MPSASAPKDLSFLLNGKEEIISEDANCSLNEWIRLHTRVKASAIAPLTWCTKLVLLRPLPPKASFQALGKHRQVPNFVTFCNIHPRSWVLLGHFLLWLTCAVCLRLQSSKLSCGEGGCGACAVSVQYVDPITGGLMICFDRAVLCASPGPRAHESFST